MNTTEQSICTKAGLTSSILNAHNISLSIVDFKDGSVLFNPGDRCQTFLILCTGSIRVKMTTKSGRDVTLYQIGSSECCILTTSALLNNEHYFAQGIAESGTKAIALSSEDFYNAIQYCGQFARYVLNGYASRISSMVRLVDRMAARDVMLDVSQYLVLHVDKQLIVSATQAEIANNIGTVREVVGRKLHRLALEEIVTLKRGSVTVIDMARLEQYAQA